MVTLRLGIGNYVDEPELKLPKIASLCIILAMNVLLQISFFIIVPSSNEYAEYLGGSSTFSGLVIGIPTVFGGLALVPMTKFDKGRYAMPLHVGCLAAILGHIAYAGAYRLHFLYLILIGRCLNGISFTGFMYTKRYCTDPRIVGIRRRTTLASWLVIGQGLGMTLGPFSGGLLYKIGFSNPVFNGYTSPGWVMACVYVVFWIIIALYFEDVPQVNEVSSQTTSSLSLGVVNAPRPSHDNQGGTLFTRQTVSTLKPNFKSGPPNSISAAQCGVVFCMCWFAMLCFFILGSWEANLPVFGAATPDLRWSPFAAGNFIALGGITAFPFLLSNVFFAGRIQDRKLLALGCGLGLLGLSIFLSLLRSGKINYGSLFMCWWAIALGFNLATTVTLSLLSKQLPPERNRWSSMVIQYANYTGRVTGAVWGGSGVSVGMLNYVGLEIALVGIGAALFATLWRNLMTKTG
ncbi:major facilitator superfamily domain-containing protein [Pisolithus croceorrhizus]|nr:major facilitator superfamily domain-containing protein [Pisolithus croceorrhizus]KAI6114899.1 major facilitator superfamily domain-containing protein [Pisolithus croceorrhizus]